MVKIAVCGAAGRMCQRIIVAVKEAGCELSGAWERPGHELVGQDAGLIAGCGALGVSISDDINAVVAGCDVLIDFTTPKVSLKNLEVCSLKKKAIVIGSTGFTPEERALAAELAKEISCVLAPNMSVGVNVCFKVLKDVAKTLGDDVDVDLGLAGVVVGEEPRHIFAGVLQIHESAGKVQIVFHGLEQGLGGGVVVRDPRAGVGQCDARDWAS